MKVSKEFKVGLFMVFGIVTLYIGFNYLKGIDFFSNTNKYYTKYDNVGGLQVSNPVNISGFAVGRVSDITIIQGHPNHVLVELDIQGDIILGDSAMAILDIGLLGETAITIDPGDVDKPIIAGDTILSGLSPSVQETLEVIGSEVGKTVQSTISRVNAILDKFTGSSDKINNMMDNIESTTYHTKMLSYESRKKLDDFAKGYNETIENLNKKISQLDPIIKKYGELADSLKSIDVEQAIVSATHTLNSIDSLITKINESEGTLNKLLTDDELYNNMNRAMIHLDSLIIHFDTYPRDFLRPLGKRNPKHPSIE
ncbi:MAG: MlaD family protein [Cyclobacteriaceae bacterium]|nr:MlaD family protein [Cyclobacteriaceae bacterium]